MKKAKLFFAALLIAVSSVIAAAQDIRVSGVVKDAASGEPLVGANVLLKGSTTSYAMTDIDGYYLLSVPKDGTLVVSILGYQTAEVAINGRATIDVALQVDANLLEETIVVAYGTATKESFTGSASMVKAETIEKRITSNVTSALAGTTPGVQITSSTGDPTSGGNTIRIRGYGSMSASNDPLIIVDGMPYDGAMKDINPNDVESMSVLKDASASAIYGARGANGVVIITTKRASSAQPNVKLDAKFGSNSRLIPQYDVITDPAEYYETWYRLMYNSKYYNGASVAEAYAHADANLYNQNNGGLGYRVFSVPEGENLIGRNFKINPNATLGYDDGTYYYTPDDWYKEAFHNSFRQEYNVSLSGNKDGLNYYASAGYLNDGGIINNSGYKRYTARINAEYQAKSWLKFTSTFGYSHTDAKSPGTYNYGSSGNVFYVANNIAPIYPLYVRATETHEIKMENGMRLYDSNNTNFKRPSIVGNAIRDNEVDRKQQYADVLNGKLGVVISPLSGLKLTANIGFTNDNTRANNLYSQFGSSSSVEGLAYVAHSRLLAVNNQYLASYATDFGGSKHSFDILAGYELYKTTSQSLSGENNHLFNPYVGELNNADGKDGMDNASSTSYYMTQGVLARAQYNYDGKYYISGSFRRDASSNFHKKHRWGNFGSLGGAWLISKEGFMSDATWVNMLKLKASYGLQGNDDLPTANPYVDHYTHSYNEATKEYSLTLSYKGNEEITWESSHAINLGVDFELFDGKLNGSVDAFDRITTDLLYNKDVPLSSGNPTGIIPVNVGSISNKGIEVTLDGSIIRTSNVSWTWNFNISHYRNTILDLDESVSEEGIIGSNYIRRIGGSLYESYVRKFAGVDQETGEALYYAKVLDEEGNWTGESTTTKVFTEASQYECGTTLPKVYGGFGTSLNAYGFDFSVQFQYQLGGKYYDGTYQSMMLTQNSVGQAIHKDILKSWTPENKNNEYPRMDGNTLVGQTAVDRFFISSNYLSINNVTLGYTIPSKLVNKAGIAGLRVYVTGDNLAVISARKGVDPRYSVGLGSYTSGTGLNSGAYSSMRNISAGITLTF